MHVGDNIPGTKDIVERGVGRREKKGEIHLRGSRKYRARGFFAISASRMATSVT
jgi:hypothetical protein